MTKGLIKGIEFVEIATADLATLDKLLRRLHFVKVGAHRSKAVHLYRQGSLNIIVNQETDAKLCLRNQASGSQIKAVAVRVDNAPTIYAELLSKGAWSCQSSLGAMELNIPGIEINGGCVLYLVENNHAHFSIYDIDFTNVEPVGVPTEIFSKIASLSLNIATSHTRQWQDFFTGLLHFTQQGDYLLSPDHSFRLKLITKQGDDIADEGIATMTFMQASHSNSADNQCTSQSSHYVKNIPAAIGFQIEVLNK